jgi:CO/xanthine dehydrogenase FAD-binding subunit
MTDVEHFSPETLDEAAALLLAAGSQVRPLADGTDLIAEVSEGHRNLCVVLNMRRIPELNRIDYDERNGLRIGAAVPFKTILEFPPVRRLFPMLADGCIPIDPGEIMESATLGGNLSLAASAADMAPPLICLRASAAIFGPYGWSEMAMEGLLASTGRFALQPGEFAVDLRFPPPPPRSNGAYMRAVARQRPDTVVGVGAFVVLEQDLSTCCGARLSLCGVVPTPARALEAERFLAGKILRDTILQEAGDVMARCALPADDSAGECLELVKGLTRRAIAEALNRVHPSAQP